MMRTTLMLLMWLAVSHSAFAGVMVESSRVIYSAGDKERSLMLKNTNDYPVIVQTWVDDGSPEGTPEKAVSAPIMPLPGIFRLEPGERKSLRLLATGVNLPKDRESLFWLNIYEIPPTDAHLPPGMSAVKVAVRLQLKTFWRPEEVKSGVDELPQSLRFTLVRKPGSVAIKVENASPYYATFSATALMGKTTCPINIGMVAPKNAKAISLSPNCATSVEKLNYSLIGDDGNAFNAQKKLIE